MTITCRFGAPNIRMPSVTAEKFSQWDEDELRKAMRGEKPAGRKPVSADPVAEVMAVMRDGRERTQGDMVNKLPKMPFTVLRNTVTHLTRLGVLIQRKAVSDAAIPTWQLAGSDK